MGRKEKKGKKKEKKREKKGRKETVKGRKGKKNYVKRRNICLREEKNMISLKNVKMFQPCLWRRKIRYF